MMVNRVLLFFLFSSPLLLHANAGVTTGFEFLRTPLYARPAAMGGAFVAASSSLASASYNPSGLAGIDRETLLFTYLNYYADFKAGGFAYGKPLKSGAVVGVSVSYISYGEMTWTDIRGETTGSSAPGDLLVTASWAKPWNALYGGVSLKYIRSQIDLYSADAMAMDAGVVYRFQGDLNLGLSVRNFGAALSGFVEEKETLPTVVCGGFSKTLAHLPLTLHFHLLRYHYQQSSRFLGFYWAVGGEFKVSERLFLRWGYDAVGEEQKVGTESERLAGLSLGFGMHYTQFTLDYAFGNHGVLESVHQFTIGYDL